MDITEKHLPLKTVFVQNLPFSTTTEKLRELFAKYGEIKQCFVVADKNKPENQCKGIGYVIFADEVSSKKCVKNKLKFGGRNLRVYYAKPKSVIKKNSFMPVGEDESKRNENQVGSKVTSCHSAAPKCKKRKLGQTDSAESNGDSEDESKSEKDEDDDGGDDDNSNNDDDDDDDNEDDDYDNLNEKSSEKSNIKSRKSSDDNSNSKNYYNSKNDEYYECESKSDQMKSKKKISNVDAEDGKTLFLRNLSYDSVEDDLEEFFEKYGPLSYCRIVVNSKTQHSQGSAFVKFKFKKDAEKCLQSFEEDSSKFVVGGRKLTVMMALTKDKARVICEEKKLGTKKGTQKNLHLIRLLLVRPGTQAAEGLSKEDLMKRIEVEAITREKLKNPNIFVSPTRLCVRNIPTNVDEKQLKRIFLNAAKDPTAKIVECRIMRDLTRPNIKGVFKSKGFGFIEFTKHENSLAAAQATNNNPEIFGNNRRLIVEFSLENKSALETKQKRLLNSQAKLKDTKSNVGKQKPIFQYPIAAPNANPLQKTLPTHWGAKIRHKPRKNINATKAPKKEKHKMKFETKEEPLSKKQKKFREEHDDLDTIISVYRNKFKSVYNDNI